MTNYIFEGRQKLRGSAGINEDEMADDIRTDNDDEDHAAANTMSQGEDGNKLCKISRHPYPQLQLTE